MRIIIQIPCFNEQDTIGLVISEIRAATQAFDDVKILIVDDGSTDNTIIAAREAGADYIARHFRNQGLARAYMTGLAVSLNIGADIIVNTDADNQYKSECIPDLIRPIIERQADLIVGARPISDIAHFSALKKVLQRLGSKTVRVLSRTTVRDATSGFRALSRDGALRLNTFTDYSYTLETLIQAGRIGLRVVSVDIKTNPPTRTSRLMRSMTQYILRSATDMLRIATIYAPFRSYGFAGLLPLSLAGILGLRYLFLLAFADASRSHAPSLILAEILAGFGFLLIAIGILGEVISINRRLLEELRFYQRQEKASNGTLSGRCDYEMIKTSREVKS